MIGNTLDSQTLGQQIEKVRGRFGIKQVVWVGDRGIITSKNIREELEKIDDLQWITALSKHRSSEINSTTTFSIRLIRPKE